MNKIMIELVKEVRDSWTYKRTYNAMQDLHNAFGFDFCKEFIAGVHNGTFTQKSLEKEYGFDYDTYCVVVVIKRYGSWCVVKLTRDNCILTDNRNLDSLSAFYTKADFNEARKRDNKVYVIAQKKEYLRKVYRTRWERYTSVEIDYKTRYDYYENERGLIIKGERKVWERQITSSYYILDKSGYCVEIKHEELENKVRKLRKEREKVAYLAMNNTALMIERVKQAIEAKKVEIATALMKSTTSDEVRIVGEKLAYWNGLRSCYSDIERIEKRHAEQDFGSPESFNSAISDIYAVLNRI